MKHFLRTLCLCFIALNCIAQEKIELSDFAILNNTSWKGNLTYKDYQTGKQTSIDATMQVEIDGEQIIYNLQYTYEPNKNNKSSVKIKKNGTYYGSEKVLSNTIENGTRTIITTYEGKDNDEKATMFITHRFNATNYTEIKEVLLENSDQRFIRNTYEFTKL